jgi:hypothetical protein
MNKVVSRFQISNSLFETVQDVMNNNSKLKSFDERNNTVNLYENRLPIEFAINHSDKIAREHARKWDYHNKQLTSLVNNRHLPEDYRAHEYAKHMNQARWHHEQYNARLDQLEAKKTAVNEGWFGPSEKELKARRLEQAHQEGVQKILNSGYVWDLHPTPNSEEIKQIFAKYDLRSPNHNHGKYFSILYNGTKTATFWHPQKKHLLTYGTGDIDYSNNPEDGEETPGITHHQAYIHLPPSENYKDFTLLFNTSAKTPEEMISKISKVKKVSIMEKITSSMSVQDIIRDFVHSNDKRFRGKTKKQRIQMALGAYYNMHPSEKKK